MHKIRIYRRTEEPNAFKVTTRRKLKEPESIEMWVLKRWIIIALGCILFYGTLVYLLF